MKRQVSALTLLLAGAAGLAHAEAALEVTDAWVAEAPPGARAQAGYMHLRNTGDTTVVLISMTSPAFASVELHGTLREGAVARMEKVPRLALRPGESVQIAPGGMHVMLIGPRNRLATGAVVPIDLQLESGAPVRVEAPVRRASPMPDAQHEQHHH